MKSLKLIGLTAAIFFTCINSYARKIESKPQETEVDNFSQRYDEFEDAQTELNRHINQLFQKVLKGHRGCNPWKVKKAIHKSVGGFLWSKIADQIHSNKKIDSKAIKRAHSIYNGVSFFWHPILYFISYGRLIKIGNHVIGTDKLEHFFDTGFIYYRLKKIFNMSDKKIYEWGLFSEKFIYGGITSLVRSKGDLVANALGFHFWKILTPNPKFPGKHYIECDQKTGKWSFIRKIDMMKFIDDGWDEGINCNEYQTNALTRIVTKNIKKLEKKNPGKRFQCPVKPDSCKLVRKRYFKIHPSLVAKECLKPKRS